jgi:hypothetical protein
VNAEQEGNPYFADKPPARPDQAADFPRAEGAACSGCGAWHRRYGPCGEGALCAICRDATR